VFLDIGDKSWGVLACQRFFGGIDGSKTLHVGDQFLSAGANDFKVGIRSAPGKYQTLLTPSDETSMYNGVDCIAYRDGGSAG